MSHTRMVVPTRIERVSAGLQPTATPSQLRNREVILLRLWGGESACSSNGPRVGRPGVEPGHEVSRRRPQDFIPEPDSNWQPSPSTGDALPIELSGISCCRAGDAIRTRYLLLTGQVPFRTGYTGVRGFPHLFAIPFRMYVTNDNNSGYCSPNASGDSNPNAAAISRDRRFDWHVRIVSNACIRRRSAARSRNPFVSRGSSIAPSADTNAGLPCSSARSSRHCGQRLQSVDGCHVDGNATIVRPQTVKTSDGLCISATT